MLKIFVVIISITNLVYAEQSKTSNDISPVPKAACPANNAFQVNDLKKRFDELMKNKESSTPDKVSSKAPAKVELTKSQNRP